MPSTSTSTNTRTGTRTHPWHGVMVATTLPFRDDLSVDLDAFADHVRSPSTPVATASS